MTVALITSVSRRFSRKAWGALSRGLGALSERVGRIRRLFERVTSSPPFCLVQEFVNGRVAQGRETLGHVVPVSRVELLKKPDHAEWSQCLDERINAGSPDLCQGRFAAVECLYSRFYRATGSECWFWVGKMRRRLDVFGRSEILQLTVDCRGLCGCRAIFRELLSDSIYRARR